LTRKCGQFPKVRGPIHSRLGPSRGCGQRGRVRDHDELSKVIRPHTFHPSRHHHAHARRRTMAWNCVSESAGSSVGMDPTRAHTPTTCNAHPKPLFLRACFHASLARVHSHTHTIISRACAYTRTHARTHTRTHTHAHTYTHAHAHKQEVHRVISSPAALVSIVALASPGLEASFSASLLTKSCPVALPIAAARYRPGI